MEEVGNLAVSDELFAFEPTKAFATGSLTKIDDISIP